ncbi:hypothetical protein LZ198_07395 [Myxococcus sp. K15C18031901]|uniref:hypothetical protein n=1 Tax=Myxococcus dinghuensis TaxID=2906761 RepID=UPI0020A7E98C|nr:hypothetical protein [Myxococcus dinghuensis]MCP3098700.1 hypothetical protein [Myxococcus dinghuensis]
MNKPLRSLLTTVAVLSLTPAAALALPCYKVCFETTPCDTACTIANAPSNCDNYGVCAYFADPSEEQATLRLDDTAPVCSEEAPDAPVSVSVES